MTIEPELIEMSEFMQYLACEKADGDRLPSLADLSEQLGISIATLREQLEVARALGLVEVRPKKGIRRQPYQFTPAVLKSLSYASAINLDYFFHAFSDLRTHVEAAYWHEAVSSLAPEDHELLHDLIVQAMAKLEGHPIQIPHAEHRELHLSIYRKINNPFVTGILEAYWEAYEAVGLNLYNDISYLKTVWEYHRQMVEAICRGDSEAGFQALVEHTNLLQQRARQETVSAPKTAHRHFE
jgi:DNA-binding FadR family transcriptional regulator